MSQPQITLTVTDAQDRQRQIAVSTARFTIGSSSDNDLAIDERGVARRHALIESFEGIVQISDCFSEKGTFVNGKRIEAAVMLKDADSISIGSARDIAVNIKHSSAENSVPKDQQHARQNNASVFQSSAAKERFGSPLIAVASVVVIIVVALPLIVLLNKSGAGRDRRAAYLKDQQKEDERQKSPDALPVSEPADGATTGDASEKVTVEQVEKLAAQLTRRISSDDKPYVFPPYAVNALDEILRRIEQLSRSRATAATLNSMTTAAPAIAAQSRREGIEPGLVICVTLAESEREQATGDHMTAARRILPDLLALRKTLGTESADKSLILVAAYKMGGGTKKSHPLLRTMTRVVKNPLTDRNVWFLRERASLDDEAYNFVLNFLAFGIIAENPRRFGIPAPPISY